MADERDALIGRLERALLDTLHEVLSQAYHMGTTRDGKWRTGGMADAEWLERLAKLPYGEWHDAKALQERLEQLAYDELEAVRKGERD